MGNYLHRTTKQLYFSTAPDSLPAPLSEYIEQPDLGAVAGIPPKYWKVTGDVVSEMTQAEKDAVDLADLTAMRDALVQQDVDSLESVLRQVVVLTVNELNDLRGWITAFKAATAAATNLANLQTRVAALPNMPDRTFSQVKSQLRDALGS